MTLGSLQNMTIANLREICHKYNIRQGNIYKF